MIKYERLYRIAGVRVPGHLNNLPIQNYLDFELPNNSIIHFNSPGDTTIIPENIHYLKSNVGKTLVLLVNEISEPIGSPKKRTFNSGSVIAKLKTKYTDMRFTADVEQIHTLPPTTNVLYSYGLLASIYKYPKNILNKYHEWGNSIIAMVREINSTVNRKHFITITAPAVLPSFDKFVKHSKKTTVSTLKIFDTPNKLTILELYKLMDSSTKRKSILNKLNYSEFENITLIVHSNTKYILINLGKLYSFIKNKDNEKGQFPAKIIFKMFMNALFKLKDDALLMSHGINDGELIDPDSINVKDKTADYDEKLLDEVEQNIKTIDKIDKAADVVNESMVSDESSVSDKLKNSISVNSNNGIISGAKTNKLLDILDAQKTIPTPFSKTESLLDFAVVGTEELKIDPEDIALSDVDAVTDKTMLKATTEALDKKYLDKVLDKDIASVIVSVNNAGILIESYDVELISDVTGDFYKHTVKLNPIGGKPSTVSFIMPKINSDGTYKSGGVEYRLRKQKVDAPIRKTTPTTVGLFSYYGRLTVNKADFKKNDYGYWVYRKLLRLSSNGTVSNVLPTINHIDSRLKLPEPYTTIARYLANVEYGDYRFMFNYNIRNSLVNGGVKLLKKIEKNGVLVGVKNDALITMDNNGILTLHGDTKKELGTFESLLGLKMKDSPVEFSSLHIFKTKIPLALILSYYIGLNNVLKKIGAKYEIVNSSTRVALKDDQFAIKFKDVKLIVTGRNNKASMLLGGFSDYAKDILMYEMADFDSKDIYTTLFSNKNISAFYIRTLDMVRDMFIDPITLTILKEMKEPEVFVNLLFRANELLLTNHSPIAQDATMMRIRGYERMAGMLYSELVKSINDQRYRNMFNNAAVNISPYSVMQAMVSDPTNEVVNDTNPIAYMKQSEDVSYLGAGGRTKDSVNKAMRTYDITALGTISESSKDDGSVGISAYLSANPGLTSLRGTVGKFDYDANGASSILSTSGMMAVGATFDEPIRVTYGGIQNTHTVPIVGQDVPYITTGYDYVLPKRVGGKFVSLAKADGVVTKITPNGIKVKYDDGSTDGFRLGTITSKIEGGTGYIHEHVTDLRKGDKFKKDDALTYNSNYFGKSILDDKNLMYKTGTTLTTIISGNTAVMEDSATIFSHATDKLATVTVKELKYTVKFDNVIKDPLKVNDETVAHTPMLFIMDSVSDEMGLFNKTALDTLKDVSTMSPKAGYVGTVVDVKVFYNGEYKDMSSSLKKLVEYSDSILKDKAVSSGSDVHTGLVNNNYKVRGKTLKVNEAVIIFYLKVPEKMGVGDKGIFGNPLKSTVGVSPNTVNTTEDGTVIEAEFGYRSDQARVVPSSLINATAITLLKKIQKEAVNIYNK